MKKAVFLDNGAKPIAPYSPGIIANGFLFVSGQIGQVDGKPLDGITAQTQKVMENLKGVVEAGGATMDDVVKCTVYISDMANFAAMNDVYKTFFPGDFPARACIAVGLPMDVLVEIECIVALP
ncbi:RidA family protein [Eubacteriales bacterium OttesenSCG-928-M02]|nr:RidA family protein [Eubacteriales bacterium OttesenSCG-928-M02]